ncbi:N-terminal domain of NEFA-interacting nuclear protein NIP30-domain-containing protein [Bisporella sp. PMI_857]|nr:N-terminal domain of NEFA-interacting nuclear protein NIP30-domain-containing protein [Bisporella sp. PMI_857]
MSSGFISGGTNDNPIERDDAWHAAHKEIEANRARKVAETQPMDGRSLFEILEANKAAKQDAFEEANRIKNQFRSLDEDEIEFLDSVLESTRKEEARVKEEMREGLEAFRRQQEEADKRARTGDAVAEEGFPIGEEQWPAGGRKRKRVKEKEVLKGVKLRRTSTAGDAAKFSIPVTASLANLQAATIKDKNIKSSKEPRERIRKPEAGSTIEKSNASITNTKTGLGLVDYGSDEDEW